MPTGKPTVDIVMRRGLIPMPLGDDATASAARTFDTLASGSPIPIITM